MAKIFNPPTEIKVPELDFKNSGDWQKNDDKYIEDLKKFLKANGHTGKNVGEIIKFPVADGHALYMVASMKPLELIHLPLGDAWNFQYVHLMTAKEVQIQIDQEKRMNEFWAEQAKKNK